MKFFVLLDDMEKICDVFQAVKVGIYEKKGDWQCIEHCNVKGLDCNLISECTRSKIEQYVNRIITMMQTNESNMVIGSAIIGVPYQIFNKHDITMCEADELSQELLDAIEQDFYHNVISEEVEEEIPPYPICLEDGYYYFHFDKAMKAHKELSSKRMLIPFLQEEPFLCLTIQCSHIMPWLDYYAEQHNLIMEIKREAEEYIVILSHNVA